jgi:hypothetical protein
MNIYIDCLNRIRQSVEDLILPPIGLLPVMLDAKRQAQNKGKTGFSRQQSTQVKRAQAAMNRIVVHHQPVMTQHASDFRDVVKHIGAK